MEITFRDHTQSWQYTDVEVGRKLIDLSCTMVERGETLLSCACSCLKVTLSVPITTIGSFSLKEFEIAIEQTSDIGKGTLAAISFIEHIVPRDTVVSIKQAIMRLPF